MTVPSPLPSSSSPPPPGAYVYTQSPPVPRMRPPRRRRRGRVSCLWMILGMALAIVIPIFCVGAGMLLYLLFPPAPLDVLILGVDARPGEGYVTRTDSIMLLGVQPRDLEVSLLSIPRDLFIDAPGYGLQRINVINSLGEQESTGGGAALLSQAVAGSFAVQPDRYMRVNFAGFVEIVDALGGIDVEVPYRLVDTQYPTSDFGVTTVTFEPGWQHMDGQTALSYARTRHADDDYRRAERQQQVIVAVFHALLEPGNWPRIPAALLAFQSAVDTDLTIYDFLMMAPPVLLDGAAGDVDRLVIDRSLIQRTVEGNAVPNFAAVNAWLEGRFD